LALHAVEATDEIGLGAAIGHGSTRFSED